MSQSKSSRSKRKVLPNEISLSLKVRKSRQHLFSAESVLNNRNKINFDNDTSNVKKSKKKKLRQTQNFLNLSGESPEEISSSVSSISKSKSPGNSEIDGVVSSEVFLETEERPKSKKSKKKKIKLPSLNLNDFDGTDNTLRFSTGNTSCEKKNTSAESLSSTTDITEDNTHRKKSKKEKGLKKQNTLQDATRTRSSRKRRVDDKSENITEHTEDKENINDNDLILKGTSSSRKKMKAHEFYSIDNETESEVSIQQMNVKDTSGKRRKKLVSTSDVEKPQMLSEELVGKQISIKDIGGSTKKKRSRKLASDNDVENSDTIVEQLNISNTVQDEEIADKTEEKGETRVKSVKTRKRRRMHDSEQLIKSNKKTRKTNVENSETSEADNLSEEVFIVEPQNLQENIINSKSRRTKLVDKQSDTPLKVNKRGKSSRRFKKSPVKEQDISRSSIGNLENLETDNTSSDLNDPNASQQNIFEGKHKASNNTPKDSRKSRKLPETDDKIMSKSDNRNSRTIRMSSHRRSLRGVHVEESNSETHDTETINCNSSDEHEEVIQRGARLSTQMSGASLKTSLIQSPEFVDENKREASRISRRSWQAVDPKTIEEIANKSSKRHSEATKVHQSVKSTNSFERMEEDSDESYVMKHHQTINYDSSDENKRMSRSSARLSSAQKQKSNISEASKTPQISFPENIDKPETNLESKSETSRKSRRSWQLVDPKIANNSSNTNSRTSMSLKSVEFDQMVDDFNGTFVKSSCTENQDIDHNVSDQNEKSGVTLNTRKSRTPKRGNGTDSLEGFEKSFEANNKSGKKSIISPNNLDGSEKVARSSGSSNRTSRNVTGEEQLPTFVVTEGVEPSIDRINLENPNNSIKTSKKIDMDFPWMNCGSEDYSLDKQKREKKDSKRKRWTILNGEEVKTSELASKKKEIVEKADNVITEEVMPSNRNRRSSRKRWSTELKRMSLNPNVFQKKEEIGPSVSERVSRGEPLDGDQGQNHSSMRWTISNASEVKTSEPALRAKPIVERGDNEIVEDVVPSNRGRRSTRKRWSTELKKMSLNPNEFQMKAENESLRSERMSNGESIIGDYEQSHLSMRQSRSLDCLEGIAPLESSSTLRHDEDQPNESQMDNTSKRPPTPPGSILKRRDTYEVDENVTDISILKSLSEGTLSKSRLSDEENDEETRKSVRFRHVTRRKPYILKNDSPSSSEYKEPEPSPKKVPTKLKATKKSVSFDHSLLFASTPITSSKKENLLKQTLKKNIYDISEKRRSRSVDDNRSKVVSRIKMPNFSKIHQRWNNQLENVTEMQARKAERARLLLSGQKPSTSNNSQKNNDRTDKHPRQLNFRSHQITNNTKFGNPFTSEPKKEASASKQTEIQNNSKKLPAISTKNIIQGKFDTAGSKNFIAKSGIPKKLESKKPAANLLKRTEEIKSVATKTKPHHDAKEERRTILKGVRGNRRFELLMKMRNK